MFQKGDFIIYGSSGVCLVESVGAMNMAGTVKGKLYYTLRPVYSGGSTIFTPIDNDKIVMRHILTREEAKQCIETMGMMELIDIQDEKKREFIYREILRECDCNRLIRLLKTLYQRQRIRLESGKKTAAVEERYIKMAEESLFGELAVAMNQNKEQVAELVREKIFERVLTMEMC